METATLSPATEIRAHIHGNKRPHTARRNLAKILWELIEDGPAVNDSGQATDVLRQRLLAKGGLERAGRGDPLSGRYFSVVLGELADVGLLDRVVRGKRTFRIEAVVSAEDMLAAGYDRRTPPTPPPLFVAPEPEPDSTPPTVRPALTVHVSSDDGHEPEDLAALVPDDIRVLTDPLRPIGYLIEATRLICAAVAELPGEAPKPLDPEVLDRLASTLEDNQRLRRKLSEAGQDITALRVERDGLRRAKAMLETNLANMAKGSLDENAYRRFVELDRMMRTVPRSRVNGEG